MATNNKLKKFQITGRTVIISTVDVEAENFENAAVKAKELKEKDFVKVLGEYFDSSLRIITVAHHEIWKTDDDN